MLKEVLIFTTGLVAGAIGASYLAGVNEGRRQALDDDAPAHETSQTGDERQYDADAHTTA